MEQAYLHPEVRISQSPKKADACGDVVRLLRKREGTLVLLCDGIGSGIKANLAANMLISRFVELLEGGFSFRACFTRTVETLNKYRHEGMGYVAFTAMWILPDGGVTILTHDAPNPLRLLGKAMACPVTMSYETIGHAIIGESCIVLHEGEGLLAMSDGITQSLLGTNEHREWRAEEIADFIRKLNTDDVNEIARDVHLEALKFWADTNGDDCTVAAMKLRPVNQVTILTGPPQNKASDVHAVTMLMQRKGRKIVCGGSTAEIVARILKKKVSVNTADENPLVPPSFDMEGVDLTTEGVVTLNQVCNLLTQGEENPGGENNAVEKLFAFLMEADRVDFIVGQARNPAAASRTLQQLGVQERNRIISDIVQRLQEMDKLVTVQKI